MKTIFICGLGQKEEAFLKVKASSAYFKESHILSFNRQLSGEIDYPALYRYFESKIEKLSENEDVKLVGLSLGAVLSLDYAIKNPIFPKKVFEKDGISKASLLGLLASMSDLNFENDLKKVSCPCLIICGEKDGANKKAAKKLSEKLPKARLQMIKKAGHQVNIDTPLELSKMAEKFLKNPVSF